ncbi:MAG TPA: site-specific integrase [Solirubrobacteraceae bacterium]|nr:site-specific integrase [Solirubrobacteraceae bacterium]HME04018.1 site-specific integrase [Solirubrobacteraceae bacterium]
MASHQVQNRAVARRAPRRGYGTGSLRVIGQSWVGSWYGADGRKIMRKVGPARTPGERDGLTKTQAEARFRKMRETTRPPAVAERVTMAEAGQELCRRLEIRGRKKSHRMTVESDLRNHIAPFFDGKELHRIEPKDIERYIAVKLRPADAKKATGAKKAKARGETDAVETKLAPKTIRNHLNTMHSIFDIGMRLGWCASNPVTLADRPVIKTTETRIKFLGQPELEKLLALPYPDDSWGRVEPTLYLTAAMTGLRQGELAGLRWRDVDFHARKLRVVSPYVRGEFNDPKSEESGRSVPLAHRVVDALTELRERSAYSHDSELVFCHPESGNPLDRSKLIRRFKQALAQAEVRPITFHELRHTFGTRMAAAGVPLRTIQHWMGHADAKTTQIYAHYQPSEQEADAVDRAFA